VRARVEKREKRITEAKRSEVYRENRNEKKRKDEHREKSRATL
jgi:hypothetical protein